jgi:hypothetical protein
LSRVKFANFIAYSTFSQRWGLGSPFSFGKLKSNTHSFLDIVLSPSFNNRIDGFLEITFPAIFSMFASKLRPSMITRSASLIFIVSEGISSKV